MKHVFDQVASRFARSIDGTMRAGYYARGSHFIGLARHALPGRGYVLDFGCGPGRLSLLLADAGFRVLGVDISHGMIAEARQLDTRGLPIEFVTIERAEEALAPGTYDGIVCSSVIEYVADADSLLQGFRRSLRNPGALLISFANRASIFRWYWNKRRTAQSDGCRAASRLDMARIPRAARAQRFRARHATAVFRVALGCARLGLAVQIRAFPRLDRRSCRKTDLTYTRARCPAALHLSSRHNRPAALARCR